MKKKWDRLRKGRGDKEIKKQEGKIKIDGERLRGKGWITRKKCVRMTQYGEICRKERRKRWKKERRIKIGIELEIRRKEQGKNEERNSLNWKIEKRKRKMRNELEKKKVRGGKKIWIGNN